MTDKNRIKELNKTVIVKTTKGEIEKNGSSWFKEQIERGKNELENRLIEKSTPFHEVKYFHSSGKSMPNGINYQRGNYIHECSINATKFQSTLNEGIHGEQYGLVKYRGGMIVFSTDVNAVEMAQNKILNKLKQIITTYKNSLNNGKIIHNIVNQYNSQNDEYIGAYNVGNFFYGKYVGDNGEMYNEKSLTVEVAGLSSRSLLTLAELIAKTFMQETVLVKDYNLNKIYLADTLTDSSNFDDEIKNINTAVNEEETMTDEILAERKECFRKVMKQAKTPQEDVMRKYYNIESNGNAPVQINEVTLNRIIQKHGNNGLIAISANRSNMDDRYNIEQTKKLITDIKNSGFSYLPTYGGYRGTDGVEDSYESSFVVFNYDINGNPKEFSMLYKFAIEMCKKYNQDSVLIKEPNKAPIYVDCNGNKANKTESNKVFKNDPKQLYFTSIKDKKSVDSEIRQKIMGKYKSYCKRNNLKPTQQGYERFLQQNKTNIDSIGKRYTYDIGFDECYVNPMPCTLNERRRRTNEIMVYPYFEMCGKNNNELNKAGLYGLVRIDEGGINRLMSHGKNGFVILSANRGEINSDNPNNDLTNEYYKWLNDNKQQDSQNAQNVFLKQRNKQADKQLMADIVVAGYSYSPVYGGYKGTDGVVDNFEPSFVVYNNQKGQQTQGNAIDFTRLYRFAIDM